MDQQRAEETVPPSTLEFPLPPVFTPVATAHGQDGARWVGESAVPFMNPFMNPFQMSASKDPSNESIIPQQVPHLDLSGHYARNMAKFKEDNKQRKGVPNRHGNLSKRAEKRQQAEIRRAALAKSAAHALVSPSDCVLTQSCRKKVPTRALSPVAEPEINQIMPSASATTAKSYWNEAAYLSTATYSWNNESEMKLILSIKDKGFHKLGQWTLDPEGCDESKHTYLRRLQIGMSEYGIREVPTDAQICLKLLQLQFKYGKDSQAFRQCEKEIQQALDKEAQSLQTEGGSVSAPNECSGYHLLYLHWYARISGFDC